MTLRRSFRSLLFSSVLLLRPMPPQLLRKNCWPPAASDRSDPDLAAASPSVRPTTPSPTTCSAAPTSWQEEWDRGITACERARNLDPQKSLYSLWLGRVYGEKADHVGAFSPLQASQRKFARHSSARWNWTPRVGKPAVILPSFYLEAPGIVGGGKDKARAQADAIMPLNPAMAHWV